MTRGFGPLLKLFIGSHGAFASGILSAVEVLLGKQGSITTYDAFLDDSTVRDAADAFFSSLTPEDQAVLVSDLYGGSVNTTLCGYLDRPNTMLISGANLALILALALEPAPVTADRIRELVGQARDQLRVVVLEEAAPATADPDFFD